MVRTYVGNYDGKDLHVAVVVSRFNETIARRLLDGALDCLARHGVDESGVSVVWVPGAFELPGAAARLASSTEFDAVVCLGVVIRGETPHFDYVAGQAAAGITDASLRSGVPVTFGVLTTDTTEQAAERAGGKMGNKGFDAALAALEMASVYASLPKPQPEM